MYSLMVFDDEQIVIESVKHIVDNEFANIQVTQTARSGREAIEKVRLERPDIILTDIRMPGINGLEAVKEIKKIHHNIKFIIMSVYEYFEFAQQAVELGACEYLTKPVNRSRLVETLERIVRELDEERRKFDQELETKEKLDKMLSVLEHSFIYSLLLSQEADIGRYKELFDIQCETGYIFILTFGERTHQEQGVALGDSVQNQKFYTFFRDCLKYKSKCIVGPVMLDRVVVYVAQSVEDEYSQRVAAISYIESIVRKIEHKYNMKFKVGIGKIHSDRDILISYQEALKALNHTEGQKIIHIDDIAPNISNMGFEMFAEENRLIKAIEKGDSQLCLSILTDMFSKYDNIMGQEGVRNRLIEIVIVAHRLAIENGVENDKCIEYSGYLTQLLGCTSRLEFEQMLIEKIGGIARRISRSKEKTIGFIVDKANKIISERFNQELTLDDISKELYISPQYFSRLYKQEMGINFIEKLTAVRMENAKKLMKSSDLSIKEICYLSGYSDPNYFSRLFKKFEGVSPSTYQKQI